MRLDIHHHIEVSREVLALIDAYTQKLDLIIERLDLMATKEQLDKLTADVAALITAGVAEINAAVAAAQTASNDPAIDQLDAQVTAATKALTDAAAKFANPPAAPAA